MNSCLFCQKEMQLPGGFQALFQKAAQSFWCEDCIAKWAFIKGPTCPTCHRWMETAEICLDCKRWQADPIYSGCLDENISVLAYNSFCQQVLAQYKYRGDYILAVAIADLLKSKLKQISFDLITPIPLSEERRYERGFNQSEALITALGKKPTILLTRMHTEKQSKKTRKERLETPQVFRFTGQQEMSGKKVLIVDDIYTTGTTLYHAAKLLKEAGASEVRSLTMARS
ncbi:MULTISPECIES: ComF family protein [Cytobacillus]|uniref:ComF family protein n=1 Tax=Cytobacillus TaxID=2675230 RepID=UPI0025A082DA|nr:ComF family protein [Cytobacillus kochii]MDM5209305.1 ComF family protein [Cytobacillus kochii]